ncbi:hypothetical protein TNCV_3806901 [Trichonephila clavipes]|nr:hypothetical protein TNCV_3806901 [Trichonephila clavipes]
MPFIETTVPDTYGNSWNMWAFDLEWLFRTSLDNTCRSLSLTFVGLLRRNTFRKSPIKFHFLTTKATVNFVMFNSLDMYFKNRQNFYGIRQLCPSRSQRTLNFVASYIRLIPMLFPTRYLSTEDMT